MIKTFFDFCSGIGAGRLGLEQCGLKCVGHSDTSRLADKTYMLMHNTAEDKNYGNLKKLGKETCLILICLLQVFLVRHFQLLEGKQVLVMIEVK